MGNPYSPQTVSGYNANPPPDDGSKSPANLGSWAMVKTKIGDPLKNFADSINAALVTAFSRIVGGGGIVTANSNYNVIAANQGAVIRATVAGITITTPSAAVVGTPFVFTVVNGSTGDIIVDAFDTQTIDGSPNVTIPAGSGMTLNTDGSQWFSGGQNFQRTQIFPQGYLTCLPIATFPLSPMPTADVTAAIIFYRPFRGNLLPISNGVVFAIRSFSELQLTLAPQHLANNLYDVFAYDDAGTIKIGTGPAWANITAGNGSRGTGGGTTELIRLNGLYVNANAITLRNGATVTPSPIVALGATYLGSIYIDGTAGQVTCHVTYGQNRKWGVFNAYNRQPIGLKAGDPNGSWTYGSAAIRASNGNNANKLTTFTGLAEEWVGLEFIQRLQANLVVGGSSSNGTSLNNLIGVNSVTAAVGLFGHLILNLSNGNAGSSTPNIGSDGVARHDLPPGIGINDIQALESSPSAGGTNTYFGQESGMRLSARWMG